jgi:hypothetical protein
MVKRATNVLRSARRLPALVLPALVLAGFVPATLPTPTAAGGNGPFYPSITVSARDVSPGTGVTVTATTSMDVGPTPYYTQIYDMTTGARIAVCGSGTVCSQTTSYQYPHFGRFEAFVGDNSYSPPPPNTQGGGSGEADVAWNAIDVTLSGLVVFPSSTQYGFVLTANSAVDVGPTPYYIEIFNITTGAEVASCGSGTSCSGSQVLPMGPTYIFQAFVTNSTTTVPTSFQGASPYAGTGGKG